MSNVLSDRKKQQVIALGRLNWSLRRIQKAVGVRRETASSYLKEAGIEVRPPGGWGWPAAAKPAKEVITDPAVPNPAIKVITDSGGEQPPKPAIEVTTDSAPDASADPQPGRSPSASACLAYRDAIEVGLSRGRNAMAIWQDLVDAGNFTAGYQSVRRFIRKLQASSSPEPRAIIETAPGEDYGEPGVMVRAASPVARAHCWAAYFAAPSFP